MRIVIDLQGAQTESRVRGIGRYSLSLARAMARNAGEHEIWLVLSSAFPDTILDIRLAFSGLVPSKRIRVFQVPLPVAEIEPENDWRARAAEKIREHFIAQLKPDVVFVSSLFEGLIDNAVTSVGSFTSGDRTAVTLYDLIPFMDQARYLPNAVHRDHYFRKLQSLKKARLLLAISESARQEAIDAFGLLPECVVNISTAIDDGFRPIALAEDLVEQLRVRYDIKRKMVMYAPGGFDTRKNVDGLIKAYALLPAVLRAEHQLIIVSKIQDGDRLTLRGLQKSAGLADDELVLTGYVSDPDLIALYNLATLFVYPSKHEGFGLPALEAMACGAPTIGSNTSSVPEVIGWDDALFDPVDLRSIAKVMERGLCDEAFRRALCIRAVSQAAKFSWDGCAKRALTALELLQSGVMCVSSSGSVKLIDAIAEISACSDPSDSDLASVAAAMAFNDAADIPKQLLLDVSELVQRDAMTGIQRVVKSILKELLNSPPAEYMVRPIYFDGTQYRYADRFASKFLNASDQDLPDEIVEFNQDDTYLSLDLNAAFTSLVHDFHHHLRCIGVHLYFVVYDILLVQRPDWWPAGTSDLFEQWLRSISQVATGLVCISESVAEEVRCWLKGHSPQRPDELQIRSFHLGADLGNSMPTKGMPDDAQSVLATLKSRISFLMVGTVEPRKGHAQTLATFEQLWDSGHEINLVIVGKAGWLVDSLVRRLRAHPELNRRLFWLNGVSDQYLGMIYAASTCLIVASEGEGFGLPLIEAAQHGLPIIARDIPVFREVAGDHAFYISANNSVELAAAIQEWLALYATDEHPKSDAMSWLTWKRSAANLIEQIDPIKRDLVFLTGC